MLLAEAMDTESVASDVDYTDSEVDEVDEAVSDGSNGISDYDTSEEDHLLEDVDLSSVRLTSCVCKSHMSLRKMSVGLGFRPRGTIPSFHLFPIVPAGRSFYLKIQFL